MTFGAEPIGVRRAERHVAEFGSGADRFAGQARVECVFGDTAPRGVARVSAAEGSVHMAGHHGTDPVGADHRRDLAGATV